jgi:hypothetical protein
MDLRTLPAFLTLFTIYDIGRLPTGEITFIPHLRWQKMVENFKSTIRCRLSANVVTLSSRKRMLKTHYLHEAGQEKAR